MAELGSRLSPGLARGNMARQLEWVRMHLGSFKMGAIDMDIPRSIYSHIYMCVCVGTIHIYACQATCWHGPRMRIFLSLSCMSIGSQGSIVCNDSGRRDGHADGLLGYIHYP